MTGPPQVFDLQMKSYEVICWRSGFLHLLPLLSFNRRSFFDCGGSSESYLISILKINSNSEMIFFTFKLYSCADVLKILLKSLFIECLITVCFPSKHISQFPQSPPRLRNPAVVMEQSEGVNITTCWLKRHWRQKQALRSGLFRAVVTPFFTPSPSWNGIHWLLLWLCKNKSSAVLDLATNEVLICEEP